MLFIAFIFSNQYLLFRTKISYNSSMPFKRVFSGVLEGVALNGILWASHQNPILFQLLFRVSVKGLWLEFPVTNFQPHVVVVACLLCIVDK